ncbi:MAG: CAP domain-containing protein [Clostridia bacterium]
MKLWKKQMILAVLVVAFMSTPAMAAGTRNRACGNDKNPGSACAAAEAMGGSASGAGQSVAGTSMTALAQEVVRQTNMDRAKKGLSPLVVSEELTRAACVRAQEIVKKFSHTRPDGSKWTSASSAARGENIAKGQQSADKVMAAWMSSQGHRANILRASFGSIGVCAYRVNNIMYWAQLFGK